MAINVERATKGRPSIMKQPARPSKVRLVINNSESFTVRDLPAVILSQRRRPAVCLSRFRQLNIFLLIFLASRPLLVYLETPISIVSVRIIMGITLQVSFKTSITQRRS